MLILAEHLLLDKENRALTSMISSEPHSKSTYLACTSRFCLRMRKMRPGGVAHCGDSINLHSPSSGKQSHCLSPLAVHVAWAGAHVQDPRQIITPLSNFARAGKGYKWVQREWFLSFYGTAGMRVSVSSSGLEGWEGDTKQQADPKMERKHPLEWSEGWVQLCPMPRHLGMIQLY